MSLLYYFGVWGRETARAVSSLIIPAQPELISMVGKIPNPKLVLSKIEVSQIENCCSLADRPC